LICIFPGWEYLQRVPFPVSNALSVCSSWKCPKIIVSIPRSNVFQHKCGTQLQEKRLVLLIGCSKSLFQILHQRNGHVNVESREKAKTARDSGQRSPEPVRFVMHIDEITSAKYKRFSPIFSGGTRNLSGKKACSDRAAQENNRDCLQHNLPVFPYH
jgi:hypothetical protein